MALTRKLTKSLTRSLTRKLTGAELQQLFLEKFKLTFGSELVVNGDFSHASDGWSLDNGFSIGSGTLNRAAANASFAQVISMAVVAGKTYDIKFDIVNHSTGTNFLSFGGDYLTKSQNANGSYSYRITATTAQKLQFYAATNAVYSIDNVSVKEITKQAPIAAFSLRKLGDVSPYAARIRRSFDNTEAQVEFDASERVSESSVVRNTSMNLIPFSEQFSLSDWVKYNISVTPSSITDPFGGTNAYKYAEASTASNNKLLLDSHAVSSGKSYTLSLYAKKGELEIIQLILGNVTFAGGNNHANFNLTSGTVTATGGGCSARIESAGDDWFRISITDTTSASGNVQPTIVLHNSATGARASSYTGNGTDGVYIFGCQSEETVLFDSSNPTTLTSLNFEGVSATDMSNNTIIGPSGNSTIGSVALSGETSNPISGTQSLKLSITGGNNSTYPRIYTTANGSMSEDAEIGSRYRATFDTKLVSGSATLAGLGFADGGNKEKGFLNTNSTSDNVVLSGTQSHSFENTITELTGTVSARNDLFFSWRGTEGNSVVLIDNIKVEKLPPIPSEYISTPVVSNDGLTFTESTLDTFVGGENLIGYTSTMMGDGWSNTNAEIASSGHTDPFGGTTAISARATGTDPYIIKTNNNVIAGQKYVFSMYMKGVGTTIGKKAKLQVWFGVGTATGPTTFNSNYMLTSEWQRFELEATPTGSGTVALRFDPVDTAVVGEEVLVSSPQLNTDTAKDYAETVGNSPRDGNASVVVLYNQTGGEDIIQDTAGRQPLLYKGGLLVKANSVPSMQFDGSDDSLKFSDDDFSDTLNLNSLSSFVVFKSDQANQTGWVLTLGTNTGTKRWYAPNLNGGNFQFSYGSSSGTAQLTADTNTHLASAVAGLNSATYKAYLDGDEKGSTAVQTNSGGTDIAVIGAIEPTNSNFNGKISELVIFDSEQNINREAIEADIANFHNITLS